MASKKINIALIIFVLIVVALIAFFIRPLLAEIKMSSKEAFLEKNNIATLGIQANEIENFEKNYSLYKPDLEKMEQLFIDSKNPVDFIKFLEKTASDLEITSKISLLPPPKKGNQNFISFQFFSSGDFSKMLEFSEKLETGPYLIEIKNLTIKNSTEQNISKNYSPEKVDTLFLIKAFTKQ
ncbi:MAG: hypothetical protein AAB529_01820 [Patescibacteria group bacterium]